MLFRSLYKLIRSCTTNSIFHYKLPPILFFHFSFTIFTPYQLIQRITNAILSKIREYNIVINIFEYNLKNKNKIISYLFNDFLQAFFPALFIRSIVKDKWVKSNKNYDYITITSGTELEVALTRVFKNAKTIAYDDGLGSYTGYIVPDHKLNLISRILGRTTKNISPEVLYVNNKEFCECSLSLRKEKLIRSNEANENYQNMISDIFNYKKEHGSFPYINLGIN